MARKARRSRKGRMPAGLARYWAKRRRVKRNPAPARRRRRSASVSAAPVRHRRRRSSVRVARRYRRNPSSGMGSGFLMDAMYVTGGFFATRFTAGMVLPMLGTMAEQPIVRIAGKGAVAWGLGFLGGKFLGQKHGQLLMLGGLVEVLSDAVRTYVSPFVPALAEGMSSYPALPMSSYPSLNDGYSNPYSVGVSEFDEAL